jgi:hypothetical protein
MPSALAPAEAATTPSAARSAGASPLYRGPTVVLFLSGLGTSAAAPQITLFLVSSTAIASALGGLTGSLGVSVLGLPHVFFAPALYGLIAGGGIAVMSRGRLAVH